MPGLPRRSTSVVGGLAAVTRDVIPSGSAWGNHARLHGLNLIGLKRRGFTFVGPVTMYALMEAIGIIDHRLPEPSRG